MSASDLFDGEEPAEHGGGEQTDRGEERGLVPGALWPESGPDSQPGQYPPAHHGELHVSFCPPIPTAPRYLTSGGANNEFSVNEPR